MIRFETYTLFTADAHDTATVLYLGARLTHFYQICLHVCDSLI
jgi:hypothetical protein